MQLGDGRESSNIDDRRGLPMGGGVVGGGIGTILLVLAGLYFGVDPAVLLNVVQGGGSGAVPAATSSPRCWPTPRTPGRRCSASTAGPTSNPSWCCTPG